MHRLSGRYDYELYEEEDVGRSGHGQFYDRSCAETEKSNNKIYVITADFPPQKQTEISEI
jgi:hypothetical protein